MPVLHWSFWKDITNRFWLQSAPASGLGPALALISRMPRPRTGLAMAISVLLAARPVMIWTLSRSISFVACWTASPALNVPTADLSAQPFEREVETSFLFLADHRLGTAQRAHEAEADRALRDCACGSGESEDPC